MAEDAPKPAGTGRSPGYIPRPPSKEEVDRISEQQGMITDEWAPQPDPPPPARGGKPPGG